MCSTSPLITHTPELCYRLTYIRWKYLHHDYCRLGQALHSLYQGNNRTTNSLCLLASCSPLWYCFRPTTTVYLPILKGNSQSPITGTFHWESCLTNSHPTSLDPSLSSSFQNVWSYAISTPDWQVSALSAGMLWENETYPWLCGPFIVFAVLSLGLS